VYDEAWLLGAESTGLGEWGPIANLVATAVITLVFVWILTKRDPAEREANRRELAEARKTFIDALDLERLSREASNKEFMAMITTHREMSHAQRMEDRKVYQESLQTMLRDFLASIKEIKNGHA
jgi:hypothetical protein